MSLLGIIWLCIKVIIGITVGLCVIRLFWYLFKIFLVWLLVKLHKD